MKSLYLVPLPLSLVITVILAHSLALPIRQGPSQATDLAPRIEQARLSEAVTVHARSRGGPWINLGDGHDLVNGGENAGPAQEKKLQDPLTLATGDFDEDGVPDLIHGHSGHLGGYLFLQKGNIDSIYPNTDAARQRKASGEFTEAPFLSPASLFVVPEAPYFIGVGDFDADGHQDVVTTAPGAQTLYWFRGNGEGGFWSVRTIALPGKVTTFVTGEINRADGLIDIVVGIAEPSVPQILVFSETKGALRGEPQAFPLPARATALALGRLDNDFAVDLAIAAGQQLFLRPGQDNLRSFDADKDKAVLSPTLETIPVPFAISAITMGQFAGDLREEVALLSDEGSVHLLETSTKTMAGELRVGIRSDAEASFLSSRNPASPSRMTRGRVSTSSFDDLILVDTANRQLHIVMGEMLTRAKALDAEQERLASPVSLDVEGEPVAALTMRLNVDALGDLVVLKRGGAASLSVVPSQSAATFTVNETGDEPDASLNGNCDVDAAAAGNQCTLRAAIQEANSTLDLDTINFALSGTPTIRPVNDYSLGLAGLPVITAPVVIDGTTQGGGKVELDGSARQVQHCLQITGGGSTVRGLVINRFDNTGIGSPGGDAIRISVKGNNFVEGNFIGTDTGGTNLLPNVSGVSISGPIDNINTIGGTASPARNIISGNEQRGIRISGTGAIVNKVQGNYIGTNAAGNAAVPNLIGVEIINASGNVIGGEVAGSRNVISGNQNEGVVIGSFFSTVNTGVTLDNKVQGNFIGLQASGNAALGNGRSGILIGGASQTTVGGSTPITRNAISDNGKASFVASNSGVLITGNQGSDTTNNTVEGNLVGTDTTGTVAIGNRSTGIKIDGQGSANPLNTKTNFVKNNVISGNLGNGAQIVSSSENELRDNRIGVVPAGNAKLANGGAGVSIFEFNFLPRSNNNTIVNNHISGNNGSGITIEGAGGTGTNVVRGNLIGTNGAGNLAIPNGFQGIFIAGSPNNMIGGSGTNEGNLISGNTLNGVVIRDAAATGNTLKGNYIGTNSSGTGDLGNLQNGI